MADDLGLQFIRTAMFQGHETMDHPLAIVYAVDIHASDCTEAALDLLRPHLQPRSDDPRIPPAMASASVLPFWDPDFPRHFVLVADAKKGVPSSDQIKSKAEALIKAVNSAIPGGSTARVSMLTLNSGSGSTDEEGTSVDWDVHMHCTLPAKADNVDAVVPSAGEPLQRPALPGDSNARGCWLSTKNLEDTRNLVSTIIRAYSSLSAVQYRCSWQACGICIHLSRGLGCALCPEKNLIFNCFGHVCHPYEQQLVTVACRRHTLQLNGAAHECCARDCATAQGWPIAQLHEGCWSNEPHFAIQQRELRRRS